MTDEDDGPWVARKGTNMADRKLHTNRDCQYLSNAARVDAASDAEVEELDTCNGPACGGGRRHSPGAGSGHLQSLREAPRLREVKERVDGGDE